MTDKQNKTKVASSQKRLLIAITSIVILIVVIVSVSVHVHNSNKNTAGATMQGLPTIASVPGAGNPTDAYVAAQNQDNSNRTKNALKHSSSAVPTITRSSFVGDMSPFELDHNNSDPNYKAPEHCRMPSAGPEACSVDKLKLARAGGVDASELRCRGCQCPALKLAGYGAGDMKAAGWDASTLRACGYSLSDLVAAGFSAADLAAAGYSLDQLKKAGFSAAALKAAGFSAAQLKNAGFSAADLAAAGFSAKDLNAAGFSAADLKNAGFSAADLKAAGFSPADLKKAGYSAASLLAAGFSPADLKKVGFSAAQIAKGEEILAAKGNQFKRCSVSELKKSRQAGLSAVAIKKLGCSAAAMRAAGYTAAELKAAGFSAKDLRGAGFSAADLKAAGFSAKDLKAAGFSAADLKKAGFSAAALKAAGFSAAQLKNAGFSAADLEKAGFSAADLKKAGYSAAALKDAGFSAADLKKAGFSPADLRAAGFTAADLKKAGFSPDQLRAAGYTDGDLLRAGFKPKDLGFGSKDGQCSVEAIKKAKAMGVPASALRDKGCSAYALRQAGYSAADLKAAGFTAGELRDSGFSAADLKKAGFSAADLRAAGFSAKQLAKAGFTPGQLHAAGFTAAQLQAAGYSAKSGGSQHCSPQMLEHASKLGISAKDLLAQGCSAADLTSAGISIPTDIPANELSASAAIPAFSGGSQQQRLAYLQAKEQAQMVAQQQQQQIQMQQQQMMTQAHAMLTDWGQQTAPGAPHELAPPQADKMQTGGAGSAMSAGGPIVKAGSVMFAVLQTGINSDENSPILAKIVDGPLKGSKLLGQFKRVNDKVVLSFNIINMPGYQSTTQVNAVAIDAKTARTAVSGLTNHHYWLRYGSLFASSFISGVSEGLVSSSQTLSPGLLMPVLQQKKLSPTEEVMTGLGKAGSAYASVMGANFHVPPTVKIPSGVGIGLLFMADFKLPANGGGAVGVAGGAPTPILTKSNSNSGLTAAAAAVSSMATTGTQIAQSTAHALGGALSGQQAQTNS